MAHEVNAALLALASGVKEYQLGLVINLDACRVAERALQGRFEIFAPQDCSLWQIPVGAVFIADHKGLSRFVDDAGFDG